MKRIHKKVTKHYDKESKAWVVTKPNGEEVGLFEHEEDADKFIKNYKYVKIGWKTTASKTIHERLNLK